MQKANLSDPAASRRSGRLHSARGLLAALLSATAVQALWIGPVVAADEAHSASSSSMQQVIDAARRKKAQELEAAARRLLGTEGAATLPAATAPSASAAPAKSVEIPKVWSLTGVGQRLDAELLYEGRIHRVSVPDTRADARIYSALLPQVGPWRVQAISPNSVTVSMQGPATRSGGKGPRTLLLPAPSRGSSMAGYIFSTGPSPSALAGTDALPSSAFSPASLAPSALRASELPLPGPTAMVSHTDLR